MASGRILYFAGSAMEHCYSLTHSPVSLWLSFLLHAFPFGSFFAADAVHSSRPSHLHTLQALGGLLEGELNLLTFLQTPKPLHVQLTLRQQK